MGDFVHPRRSGRSGPPATMQCASLVSVLGLREAAASQKAASGARSQAWGSYMFVASCDSSPDFATACTLVPTSGGGATSLQVIPSDKPSLSHACHHIHAETEHQGSNQEQEFRTNTSPRQTIEVWRDSAPRSLQ